MTEQKIICRKWFEELRDLICQEFERLEQEFAAKNNLTSGKFERKAWSRSEKPDDGGVMSIMRGALFEKVGVNVSTVYGDFTPEMQKNIPGAQDNPRYFATGISVVAHLQSPLVPAAHFNTRYIETTKSWFGGGGDLTPTFPEEQESNLFHQAFKAACDRHNPDYYPKFKAECDKYFFLKHRQEPRGIGGIFYDYLNNNDFQADFAFTQDVGRAFAKVYPQIIANKMFLTWTDEQRKQLLIKRGRYVEFNLLYDRGTQFGLMTGGNVEAILMSLPPIVHWP